MRSILLLFFRLVVFVDVELRWKVGGTAQSLDYLVSQRTVVGK